MSKCPRDKDGRPQHNYNRDRGCTQLRMRDLAAQVDAKEERQRG